MKSVLAWMLGLALGGISTHALPWTEQEVAMQDLQGTMTMPEGSAPAPAVLIIAGSGSVNRDGNLRGARSDNLKLLAHGLADQGIASLRIDKRGVARSRAGAPREEDLRFDTYVKDAASWLGLLRSQARVSRVFLLGHSEGALVATLAAQSGHVAGLILLAGASEPAARLIERQLAAGGMPAGLQDQSRRIAAALERGVPVCCVPPELGALYRESAQGYLMSWLPLDPARELSTVKVPVLVVQGTTDLQIDVEDARRLAAARPGSTLQLIENMNHVLKEASPARAENLATYNVPQLPLAPPLVPAIAAFVRLDAN